MTHSFILRGCSGGYKCPSNMLAIGDCVSIYGRGCVSTSSLASILEIISLVKLFYQFYRYFFVEKHFFNQNIQIPSFGFLLLFWFWWLLSALGWNSCRLHQNIWFWPKLILMTTNNVLQHLCIASFYVRYSIWLYKI